MIDKILAIYDNFKEKTFSELKFNYKEYLTAIKNFNSDKFEKKTLGKSFEDRDIYLFKTGKGKTKVLFWSQMHGNEPISTQALVDLMNFFCENNEIQKSILENCTIFFIPLVNPDGAEAFSRRNAQEIDLNRDAIKKTAPESKILDEIINKIHPDFAFNLHDQERYYGTQNSEYPTALSFLTPSYDFEKTIDIHREKSMKLIASINEMLQSYLLNRIAKYSDAFMPNAFGDNVQKKKIATILFEAGYIPKDEQRQEVRKYYFLSLIHSLIEISNGNYTKLSIDDYQKIPMNIKLKFCDFILKNITIENKGKNYVTDIAVIKNILDSEKFTDFIEDYIIWDIGDFENKSAFKIIDFKGVTINNSNKLIKRLKKADFLLNYLER